MKSIDKSQILKNIERANPWWRGSSIGEFKQLPKRAHFDRLLRLTKQSDPVRALVLMGPRRVGKTVLVYQIIDHLVSEGIKPNKLMYLSLDSPLLRFSSLEELVQWGFEWSGSDMDGATVFFDEIQYLDTWEQQLKLLVDTYRKTKFIVTGSAAAALHKKSKESGAGRFTNYLVPSLSFYKFISIKGGMEEIPARSIDLLKMNALYLEYLNYGGFPESISSEAIRNQPELYIGQDILDKVLGRDLPSIYSIDNPNELQRLFAALAYNTSNEISPESISQQAGVSKKEINRYLEFFEAAYLIRVIEKTDDTLKKFQRRTHFKVVLTNPSLRAAIFGKISEDDKELEGLAETAVFSQLFVPEGTYLPYKYARWNRGGSKGEVDLVHVNQKNKVVTALEIKWSDRFANKDDKPKSLLSFCKDNQLTKAYMTSKSQFATVQYGDVSVEHIPTSALCFLIGMMTGLFDVIRHVTIDGEGTLSKEDREARLQKELVAQVTRHMSALAYLKAELSEPILRLIPDMINALSLLGVSSKG